MPDLTTTYSFKKPVVGADADDWGGYLNTNLDDLDDLLDGTTAISPQVSGGTITNSPIENSSIGATTASSGAFTTLSATGTVTFGGVDITATAAELNYLDVTTLGTVEGTKALTADASGEVHVPDDKKIYFGTDDDAHISYDETTDDRLEIGGAELYVDHTVRAKRGVGDSLTDTAVSGVYDLDFSATQNFILTLTGSVTSLTASNAVAGQSGFIVFIQDTTGGYTVSPSASYYKTAGGVGVTLSTAADSVDVVPYIVQSSSSILLGTPLLAFA